MKKESRIITKQEAMALEGIKMDVDVIYPIIVMNYKGKQTVLKNGKLFDQNECIIIGIDSQNEYLEFDKLYNASGFDFELDDNIKLKRMLPTMTKEQFVVLHSIENINELLLEYLES